ncbi:MAG: hypothetical protein ACLT1W_12595 [Alistipes onderdonkii]
MITKLEQLIEAVRGRDRKTLVAAYAQDAHTLEAVSSAVDMGIVNCAGRRPGADREGLRGRGHRPCEIHGR